MTQPIASNIAARDFVFVDSRVQDSAGLLQDLAPGAQVIYLRAGEDGLEQMAAALGEGGEAGAVHILAHGSEGQMWLGTTFLDPATLAGQADALAAVGRGLTADGDILVYACNLANGDAGAAFVARLADLTGADVAASSNVTGVNSDWQLEIATGSIEASAVLDSAALQQYGHSLSTLTVTTGLDSGLDTTIGASLAADTSDGGGLSLREALNWAGASDTITFNAGMTVSLNSVLTINKNLTIDGDLNNDNTADVTLDGQYRTQVASVSGGTTTTLEGLVITHGMKAGDGGDGGQDALVANGGGIYNAGTLTLNNVMISANAASGGGGGGGVSPQYAGGGGGGGGAISPGIGGHGGDTLNSTGSNGTPGQGGAGGGFFNIGGRGGSSTGGAGGAAYPGYSTGSAGGTANAGTISIGGGGGGDGYDNFGGDGGGAVGGIYNDTGATLKIIGNSVISGNIGAGGGGGGGGAGGGYLQAGGAGGVGVGGIWNKGSVLITAANYAAMSGNVGGSGVGGTSAGAAGTSPASVSKVYGDGGSINTNYVVAPTSTIVVSDAALAIGETSLVTITFSEAVTGFTNADLTAAGGTLSGVTSGDGGVSWTATLTPTAGITDATNIITLDNTGIAGGGGTAGVGTTNSNNYAIDTVRPTAAIVVADAALKAGETSLVTFTFSEAVSGFTTADLTVDQGTVTGLSSADGGITWTGTLTPSAGIDDTSNIIVLNNAGVTDAAGNAGSGTTSSNNYAIDTVRPTAAIVVADSALSVGETSLVTITFSEAVTGLSNDDLVIANGTLSTLATSDGGITWTATFTPASGIADTSNIIQLNNTAASDAAGNTGTGTTNSNNYAVNTIRPTATVVVADTALAAGETSLVTITFSEAVSGFDNDDLALANGTLSAVSSSDGGVTWSATFTPAADVADTSNVITLTNSGVQNAAGNAGSGTTNSNNYAIDTVRPSATILVADTVLAAGETSLVTVTFSEAVSAFTTADLTVEHGAVTGLSSADGGITWTGTLTPDAAITDASNIIQLNNATVTDSAGNAGSGTTDSNNYAIDTVRPTATIVVADSALATGETSLVTITFSEAVSGLGNDDLTVANGTLGAVSSSDGGVTWTATLTPASGIADTSNIIQLNNAGVSDAAGNTGTGTTASNNYTVDTTAPTATIVVADSALAAGETSLVTITFSEAVTGFDNGDLAVANGTLSAVSSSDGGVTWSATLTPAADVTDTSNVITLANSGVQNAAGNAGVGSTSSNNYAIDTVRPAATIVVADTALMAGETSLVTFTFSEGVLGFTTADLTVEHGTVSGLSSADGGITWTGTLTPDAEVADTSNLISLANTGVSDMAGNTGSGTTGSGNYSVSTVRPTVVVALDDSALLAGETAGVTFTFSEAVTGFDNADIAVANGTLGTVASGDGGVTWTATLTPTAGVADASNVVSVDNTGYTNAAGNTGSGSTSSANYTVSTVRPTATVALSDSALKAGETATVTFTFSEAVSGFTNDDVTVDNGTLTAVASTDGGVTWTAVFTPTADLTDASNAISVSNAGIVNAAGNAGVGQTDSANYAIDTDRPDATVTLSDSTLAAGETALLTIVFDQAVTGFSGASISVANGSLSGLATLDGGLTWTANLTPAAATADASNVVSVDMSGLSDASGNTGTGLASSANYTVDTVRPSATVTVADEALLAGETSLVTIAFSQAVTGLEIADFSVANGSLSGLATADGGITWTAMLAPAEAIDDTSNVITLDNTGYTSAAGSGGLGTTDSNNYALATTRPGATIVVSDVLLGIGATATVMITFSEPVSGFTNDDLSVGAGSLSPVSSTDGGLTWTATLAPNAGVSSTGNVITLNNTGVQDADGNAGAATTVSNPYAVNTVVNEPDPEPDGTVDGVPVFSDVVTDPETGLEGTAITVPFVPAVRNDDPATPNSGLADIPLGIETPAGTPQVDLVVSLPAGAGLQAEGPNVLLSNAQALIDLINRIEGKTVAGSAVQQEMAGQGIDFLGALGSSVVLETKTLVPIVAPGATLTQPIVITGSSATPANGVENATAIALVIDASGLPSNAVLQLDNVDFAAVVGAATLRGGSGENVVIGDGAAQNILLGADDDQLYGGGGNDIVGSAGGNDLLDGGTGNDIVAGGIGNDSVSGGSGDDLLQGGRSDQGGWQFFVDASGNLKVRHDMAVFAPGTSELVTTTELNHDAAGLGFLDAPAQRLADIALLYRAVFGRVADLGGLEFWASADATIGGIASAFGGSAEWAAAGYDQLSDAGFVSKIYQNVLGRLPDAGGADFWLGKLAGSSGVAPLSRSEVLVGIALSDEHKAAASTADGIAIGAGVRTSEADWFAGSGDDRLEGGQGNDTLVGGDGIDTVAYAGARSGYKILLSLDGKVQVLDQSNGDLDTLGGIESGAFADGAADLAFTQEAPALLQQLGLLYQALFDRAGDLGGMAFWAGQYDDAGSAVRDFMATPEYAARYGSVSDTQLIEALYRNTGLQDSDAGGIQSWESYLGSHTRAELIATWIGNGSVIDAQFGTQGLWLV